MNVPTLQTMKSTTKLWRNILLLDDDSDDCALFSDAIKEVDSKFKLTITNDSDKLLESLSPSSNFPELLFLDLNMPKKNGLECLSEIRQNPELKNLPVIIISTSDNQDVVNKSFEVGANYYISKPSSYSKLKQTLAHVLAFEPSQLQLHLRESFVINLA